jgi:hypothetical protein
MWSGSLALKPDWRQPVSTVFDYLAARGLVARNPLPAELAAHPKDEAKSGQHSGQISLSLPSAGLGRVSHGLLEFERDVTRSCG